MNNAMNVDVQKSLQDPAFSSFGYISRNGILLDPMAILFLSFFLKINLFIYLYLFFGCVGSSFLCEGFL